MLFIFSLCNMKYSFINSCRIVAGENSSWHYTVLAHSKQAYINSRTTSDAKPHQRVKWMQLLISQSFEHVFYLFSEEERTYLIMKIIFLAWWPQQWSPRDALKKVV